MAQPFPPPLADSRARYGEARRSAFGAKAAGLRKRPIRRAEALRHGYNTSLCTPRAGILGRSSAGTARRVGDPERARGVPLHGAGVARSSSAAAEALGVDVSRARADDAGKILADRITWFMQQLEVPNGLRAIGYSPADIPKLVEGTLPQHRGTKLSPRPAGPDELSTLFEEAMTAW